MSSTESIYLRLERAGFPMDIAGIAVLAPPPEGPLPFEQVKAMLRQRLHEWPAVNRMIARAPLGIGEDHWTHAATLEWDKHVHHRVVPQPGDLDALLATVLRVSQAPLDRSRPLWEAWYLTGMADGGAALVLRTHHAVIDGIGVMQLQQLLFDSEPTPVVPDRQPAPLTGQAHPSLVRRALIEIPSRLAINTVATARLVSRLVPKSSEQVVQGTTRVVSGAARRLATLSRLDRPDPIRLPDLPGYVPSRASAPPVTLFNQHVTQPHKVMAVASLPFDAIKQVRHARPPATVNDVLLALVTGTIREYLAAHDDLPDAPIRTTCPVNVRNPDDRGTQGNHITTIWVDLPVHLDDPVERLAAVAASSSAAKDSLGTSQASWEALADVGDLLLPGVVAAAMAFAGTKAFTLFPPTQNLTVSTLIGSPQPLYLATSRITHMFTRTIVCPPIHLFFSSVTYDGRVDFSVTTVRQLCPDPQVLADGLHAELDRLRAATSGEVSGGD